MAKKKQAVTRPSVTPFLIVHVVVAALTLRDIGRRPVEQIRGSKGVWRFVTGINTGGAVAYWVVGRKRPAV